MGLEAPETNAPLSVNAEALGRQGTDTVSGSWFLICVMKHTRRQTEMISMSLDCAKPRGKGEPYQVG